MFVKIKEYKPASSFQGYSGNKIEVKELVFDKVINTEMVKWVVDVSIDSSERKVTSIRFSDDTHIYTLDSVDKVMTLLNLYGTQR